MPGASWKNAIKRKTHKERAQPADRAKKYGLLEKKKDYVLRARDFHKKEDKIMHLRRKAALRNPDEFYFGMQKAKTKGGVHGLAAEGAEALPVDVARLLKTQDAAYLTMKRVADEKAAAGAAESGPAGGQPARAAGDGPQPAHRLPGVGPGRGRVRPRGALRHRAGAGRPRVQPAAGGHAGLAGRRRRRAGGGRQARPQEARPGVPGGGGAAGARAEAAAHGGPRGGPAPEDGKGRKFKVKDAENGNPAVFKWKKQRQK
eukprot:CAMPEP_0194668486 /NCGR_PEP_ID=MMETSP0295-20121207/3990_1 /TAXON_ID=39354 /ORGANISM="Heterosigma akashiwo, Strain CCMP2393" /LENGTH=258 /DNA_ID=CAMNT_0039551237 /DNA_START=156 /DNA_END=934 /DNA_ORIENTATION=-